MPATRKTTKTPKKRLKKRTALIEITLPGLGQKESFESVRLALNDVIARMTLEEFKPPCKFEPVYKGKTCGKVVILNETI